jgi:hypothetical protein
VAADEPPRVSHADLRGGQHEPGVFEAGGVAAEVIEVDDHPRRDSTSTRVKSETFTPL